MRERSIHTRRARVRGHSTLGAPRVSRVLQESRDACMTPALPFFAEVTDYLQSKATNVKQKEIKN